MKPRKSRLYHKRVTLYLNLHNIFIYQNLKIGSKRRNHKFIPLS